MKYLRIFFGVFMLFFGLNRMFHFMPEPPWPEAAQQFLNALEATGYMSELISITDALAGALLLANVLVPVALILSAGILVHSILFHVFLAPETALFAFIGALINIVLIYHYRQSYLPLVTNNLPREIVVPEPERS